MRDLYEVLGVERGATDAELKAAFRRAAARHHPDRNPDDPGAQQRFTELNGAYQILADAEKRAAYDRYGERAFRPGAGSTTGGMSVDFADLDGLFGDLLGAFGFKTGRSRAPLSKTLSLSFEEAALGCSKRLDYEAVDLCGSCGGRGAEPGARLIQCQHCAGSGRLRLAHGAFFVNLERPCPACRGMGRLPTVACGQCAGKGLAPTRRTVDVDVPPGIESGSAQTIRGAGHRMSPDRPPGDLDVVVNVAAHGSFQRAGYDIKSVAQISFITAALGGQVAVPTLQDVSTLSIPAGTQSGEVLRIRNAGVPRRRGGRGDHLVLVEVTIPSSVTPEARKLIEDFHDELVEQETRRKRGVMGRLRSWLG